MLNAKNHAREAEIIAKAGQEGAVTIATNMAGRGTDIKLGEGVRALGGSGRHRQQSAMSPDVLIISCADDAGRQGDPGYLPVLCLRTGRSLMVRFGSAKNGKPVFDQLGDQFRLNPRW